MINNISRCSVAKCALAEFCYLKVDVKTSVKGFFQKFTSIDCILYKVSFSREKSEIFNQEITCMHGVGKVYA